MSSTMNLCKQLEQIKEDDKTECSVESGTVIGSDEEVSDDEIKTPREQKEDITKAELPKLDNKDSNELPFGVTINLSKSSQLKSGAQVAEERKQAKVESPTKHSQLNSKTQKLVSSQLVQVKKEMFMDTHSEIHRQHTRLEDDVF